MDQIEKLKLISEKTGIPVAELIRLGINILIKKYSEVMQTIEER